MLTDDQYTQCQRIATLNACAFIEYFDPLASHDITENPLGRQESILLARLSDFINQTTKTDILAFENHRDGYGSWLFYNALTNRRCIALDISQMRNWYNLINKQLIHTQRLRFILHELGHIYLAPNRTPARETLPGSDSLHYMNEADPVEEEMAWVFAFQFIAVLVGENARRGRGAMPPHDRSGIAHV